jgi:hypothetical protein
LASANDREEHNDLIGAHPLDKADPEKCYDAMIAERNLLITAKRSAEDELVKSIVKLSSAALLLIPGFVIGSKLPLDTFWSALLMGVGIVFLLAAMMTGMLEQFLSSVAYDKQIEIITRYYDRLGKETFDPKSASRVRYAQVGTFTFFALAVLSLSAGLSTIAWRGTVSQRPSPSPPRPSEPVHVPDHKTDVPGRSVPPPAPPPPPRRG